MEKNCLLRQFIILVLLSSSHITVWAQDDKAEIAKKLNNPIANLISVPFQLNHSTDIGTSDKGDRYILNIQPVIPVPLNDDWNVITRTIIPLVKQSDVIPGTDQEGLGDSSLSLFFSPVEPTADGWIWGVGPVFLLPTATDSNNLLGNEKWGVGPTAVALKQENGWTYGALANHIWSVAGNDDRSDISNTFLQPFLAFTTSTFTTFTVNTESTYDWMNAEWQVPVNLMATQLFKVGNQPMSLQLGARYWAEAPETGPEGWGWRLTYTLVFPK